MAQGIFRVPNNVGLFPEHIAYTVPYKLSDAEAPQAITGPLLDEDDVEDLEEAPENEVEQAEERVLDQATAASTIKELKAEIAILGGLESLAADVRRGGQDTKWRELANLLSEIFTPEGTGARLAEDPVPYGAGPIAKPNLHRARNWSFSPSIATRSIISNGRSARCSAGQKPWL